jgi:hypothetical protein
MYSHIAGVIQSRRMRVYSTHGEMITAYNVLARGHLGGQWKRIFEKYGVKLGTGLNWLRAGSSGHSKEPNSGFF